MAAKQRLLDTRLREWVRTPDNPTAAAYVINLDGKYPSGESGGHSIAFYVDQHKWQVFDPNFGEFELGFGAKSTLEDFGGDLWNHYARS